ncbi:response regulator transcription factor [Solibacillus cecembensis]|uniref:response regulator transcription factor n=1 Tax=Solibacillus cecembensis TaxID=459347 RepID=UPI00071735CB
MLKILIVDDHPAIRAGTKTILEEADFRVEAYEDINKILQAASSKEFDLYLIDLYMPGIDGLTLTKKILNYNADAKILIYTGFDLNTHYNIILDAGASGFVSKLASSDQLITSIYCALREEIVIPIQLLNQLRQIEIKSTIDGNLDSQEIMTLTRKEQEILRYVSQGFTNKKIADTLYMSQRTVEYNLTKIFSKLKVHSRAEALSVATKQGLILMETTITY